MRDHQADFRQGRGCIDQIGTLRIIVEQSLEFDSSLYINFVDYEKAFDSLEPLTETHFGSFFNTTVYRRKL